MYSTMILIPLLFIWTIASSPAFPTSNSQGSLRPSSCPEVLYYERILEDDHRWYGVIKLPPHEQTEKIEVRITLDDDAELLGSTFGEVTSLGDGEYSILKTTGETPASDNEVSFYVQYGRNCEAPLVIAIELNGEDICLHHQDHSDDMRRGSKRGPLNFATPIFYMKSEKPTKFLGPKDIRFQTLLTQLKTQRQGGEPDFQGYARSHTESKIIPETDETDLIEQLGRNSETDRSSSNDSTSSFTDNTSLLKEDSALDIAQAKINDLQDINDTLSNEAVEEDDSSSSSFSKQNLQTISTDTKNKNTDSQNELSLASNVNLLIETNETPQNSDNRFEIDTPNLQTPKNFISILLNQIQLLVNQYAEARNQATTSEQDDQSCNSTKKNITEELSNLKKSIEQSIFVAKSMKGDEDTKELTDEDDISDYYIKKESTNDNRIKETHEDSDDEEDARLSKSGETEKEIEIRMQVEGMWKEYIQERIKQDKAQSQTLRERHPAEINRDISIHTSQIERKKSVEKSSKKDNVMKTKPSSGFDVLNFEFKTIDSLTGVTSTYQFPMIGSIDKIPAETNKIKQKYDESDESIVSSNDSDTEDEFENEDLPITVKSNGLDTVNIDIKTQETAIENNIKSTERATKTASLFLNGFSLSKKSDRGHSMEEHVEDSKNDERLGKNRLHQNFKLNQLAGKKSKHSTGFDILNLEVKTVDSGSQKVKSTSDVENYQEENNEKYEIAIESQIPSGHAEVHHDTMYDELSKSSEYSSTSEIEEQTENANKVEYFRRKFEDIVNKYTVKRFNSSSQSSLSSSAEVDDNKSMNENDTSFEYSPSNEKRKQEETDARFATLMNSEIPNIQLKIHDNDISDDSKAFLYDSSVASEEDDEFSETSETSGEDLSNIVETDIKSTSGLAKFKVLNLEVKSVDALTGAIKSTNNQNFVENVELANRTSQSSEVSSDDDFPEAIETDNDEDQDETSIPKSVYKNINKSGYDTIKLETKTADFASKEIKSSNTENIGKNHDSEDFVEENETHSEIEKDSKKSFKQLIGFDILNLNVKTVDPVTKEIISESETQENTTLEKETPKTNNVIKTKSIFLNGFPYNFGDKNSKESENTKVTTEIDLDKLRHDVQSLDSQVKQYVAPKVDEDNVKKVERMMDQYFGVGNLQKSLKFDLTKVGRYHKCLGDKQCKKVKITKELVNPTT